MKIEDETFLSAFLDGELDHEQRLRVESALVSDPRLAGHLQQLAGVRNMIANLSRPSSIADLSETVVSLIERRQAGRTLLPFLRFTPRMRTAIGIGVASCFVLALIVGWRLTPTIPRHRDHLPRAVDVPSTWAASKGRHLIADRGPGSKVQRELTTPTPSRQRLYEQRTSAFARTKAERERARIRELLDSPDLRRVFLVTDVLGGHAPDRVDSLVHDTPRLEPSYGRITVTQGIVIDPRHPNQATVFALVLDDRELRRFRAKLDQAFPDAVEDGPADPRVITQLADIGQVSVMPGTPTAELVSAHIEESPASTLSAEETEKTETKHPENDEFPGMQVTLVDAVRPPVIGPDPEKPTPEQELSAPPISRGGSNDSLHSNSQLPNHLDDPSSSVPPARSGTNPNRARRHTSIVLVWVTSRGPAASGRR